MNRFINFLLGVAWAFMLIGATYLFVTYLKISLLYAFFMGFLGALPSILIIILLEFMLLALQHFEATKQQTELLLELREMLKKNQSNDDREP